MNSSQDWGTAVRLVRRSDRILLACHVSPDGDAIGSLLGLGLALRTLGKTCTLACQDPLPSKFTFLPGSGTVVTRLDTSLFDLVISLDCSDLARLGSIYEPDRFAGIPLLNIDHHVTNLYFGDVNIVDPSAASTAEIILSLLDHLEIPIDSQDSSLGQDDAGIATCLLTGIVTDTLGFRTNSVTPQVMEASMRLMEAGASLAKVSYHVFNQRPLSDLYLLARGLSHLTVEDELGWSAIRLADQAATGNQDDGDAGLASMLIRTKEIHIAAVFTEQNDNTVNVSFRADPGYDVSKIALSLGGGGHPAAAGCTVEGSIEEAQAHVLPMLRIALQEQSQK